MAMAHQTSVMLEFNFADNLGIFPNPADSYFYAYLERFNGSPVTITIQNQLGNVVLKQQINESSNLPVKVDISHQNFREGFYYVTFQAKGYRMITRRLVVTKF